MFPDCINCQFKSFATTTLNVKQMAYLQDNCSTTTFKKGEVIFKEGALSLNVAYIKTGLVKLHMHGLGGREQILKIIKAPNYLGIPTTVSDKINQYSVTALEETIVCFIDLDTFINLLLDNKHFAFQIIVDLCQKELENFKNFKVKLRFH